MIPVIRKNEVEDVIWVQERWSLVSNHNDNLVFPFFYLTFYAHILALQGGFILTFLCLLLCVLRVLTSVSPLHCMAFFSKVLCCFILGTLSFKSVYFKQSYPQKLLHGKPKLTFCMKTITKATIWYGK
jgi:hypothetical protein